MSHRVKEKAIFALVDGRLDGDARRSLEAHLAECAECRAFHRTVVAGKAALAELERAPLPQVDWSRVDSELAKKLEERKEEAGRGLPAPLLWGAVAATAAAAFLVTWGIVARDGQGPRPGEDPPLPGAKTAGVSPTDQPGEEPSAEPLVAFVTFVAGEAHASRIDQAWSPLGLETELEEGVRLRTAEDGAAGIQVGRGAGCRIEPATEVSLESLGSETARLELRSGRVTCTSGEADQPIVISVIDVVASARGAARYSIAREGPQVVVVELAEGTLRVRRPEGGVDIDGPGRVTVVRGDEAPPERATIDDERAAALANPAIGLQPRRSIASLHLPAVEGIERASVDGVEYGPLPLALRRSPGTAHVVLYPVGGAEPIVHDIAVALGPTRVDSELLVASLPTLRGGPTERRVAPRIGTYDDGQVRRLRSLVGGNVRTCYERTLKRYPNTWGRIEVRLTVSTTGEAKNVRVTSVAGGHPSVNSCIESALAATRFPPPQGGYIPVEQTITLSPRF